MLTIGAPWERSVVQHVFATIELDWPLATRIPLKTTAGGRRTNPPFRCFQLQCVRTPRSVAHAVCATHQMCVTRLRLTWGRRCAGYMYGKTCTLGQFGRSTLNAASAETVPS